MSELPETIAGLGSSAGTGSAGAGPDPANPAEAPAAAAEQRLTARSIWLRRLLQQLGPFLFVLLLGLVLSILSPYFRFCREFCDAGYRG